MNYILQYPIKSEETFSLNRSSHTLFENLDELVEGSLLNCSDFPSLALTDFDFNYSEPLFCDSDSPDEVDATPPQSPPIDMVISDDNISLQQSPVVKAEQLQALQEQQFLQLQFQQQYHYQVILQQNLMLQYQLQQLNSARPVNFSSCPIPVSQNSVVLPRPMVNQTTLHFEALSSDDTKSPLDSYSCEVSKVYDEPLGYMNHVTNLNTSCFGTDVPTRCRSIPVDISGNLSDAQYNKIFKKYHKQLLLDAHPIMTQEDLENIKLHGRMYFLRNVKTIVPKVGPWKFNAHISHRRPDERQYNIPGAAITCKVKEWLTEDGALWRLYHYKKGKVLKGTTL